MFGLGLASVGAHRSIRRSAIALLFVLILAAACSPAGSSSSSTLLTVSSRASGFPGHAKIGGTVVIDNVSGSLWTCVFNPYTVSSGGGQNFSDGIMYEPLIYINQLNNAQHPWLATGYAWSNGNKTLTFTMRSGVKWSDGKPLTAADVAFTFNLLKRFSALDLQANWTVLSSVAARGNKVVFRFKQPSVPYFYYIAGQTYILPQHIWSKIKNPVTYPDKNPVGSGPFMLKSCTTQDITYTRNPHYWQAPKPYVSTVRYPAFMDNQPGNLYLAQGKANWGGQYIPNVQAYYLSRDRANRHTWYAPEGANVSLYLNQTVYPLSIRAVRQAISYGIDRAKVSRLGVYGYLPAGNQSGIILPNFKSWYNSAAAARYKYTYNPAKVASLLKSAGFTRGSNGIYKDKKGKPLTLKIINNGGYTDWVAEVQIIRSSLRSVGIDASTQNLSGNDWTARLQSGNFQAGYYSPTGGPLPYYQFYQLLYGANSAPIGKTASSNFERYRSHYVDLLLNNYARTTVPSRQHEIINKLQQVMLQDVPVVPVLEGVHWFQYDTSQLTGWPSPDNPYASPAPYDMPDWEVVLTNVHLK